MSFHPRGCYATALSKEPLFSRQYRLQWWAERWAVKQKRAEMRVIAECLAEAVRFELTRGANP